MPTRRLEIVYTTNSKRVHYQDLEDFLARIYHLQGFNTLRAAGATHGLYPEYLIERVLPNSLLTRAALIRTGRPGDLALILTTLCVDGHIPPGRYVLDTAKRPAPIEAYKSLLRQHLDPLHPECSRFKNRHHSNPHFRKMSRVIDRSFTEWLKEHPEEP